MRSAGGFLKPHQEYPPTMLNTHIKSYHHALQVECKKNLMTLQRSQDNLKRKEYEHSLDTWLDDALSVYSIALQIGTMTTSENMLWGTLLFWPQEVCCWEDKCHSYLS
jgi:hypothetical protein